MPQDDNGNKRSAAAAADACDGDDSEDSGRPPPCKRGRKSDADDVDEADDDADADEADGAVAAAATTTTNEPSSSPTRTEKSYVDEYAGYRLSSSSFSPVTPPEIDRVHVSTLTPESFFRDYVSRRRPVAITGNLTDLEWRVPERWTSTAYLKKKAGDAMVSVERRNSSSEKFGRGNEVKMTFGAFLDSLDRGDDGKDGGGNLYLTTQDVETDSGGRPRVLSPFMRLLREDFPLRPKLAGNLIPQNVNVWMGGGGGGGDSNSSEHGGGKGGSNGENGGKKEEEGSSSGLHHDYHDNLYVVLSGTKSFSLYSPSDAPYLYPRGQLRKIHANGRINYSGEETLPDGSKRGAERALDAAVRQERCARELEEAERAVENGEMGAEERLARAERELEEAMEEVVDAEGEEEDDDDDDGDGSRGDSDDGCGSDSGEGEDGVDFWEEAERLKQKQRKQQLNPLDEKKIPPKDDAGKEEDDETAQQPEQQQEADDDDDNFDDSDGDNGDNFDETFQEGRDYGEEGRLVDRTVKDPLNFSLVDASLPPDELRDKFPLFSGARKATVEIKRGDMLYLPASWFHEVTSRGGGNDDDDGDENEKCNGNGGIHMAFNYWFHPPDYGTAFDAPYRSKFWEKDWELKKHD